MTRAMRTCAVLFAVSIAACSGAPDRSVSTPAGESGETVTPEVGAEGGSPQAGGAGEPAACATSCADVSDCACGRDRATGECAVGRAECIDTGRQCSDFCTGFAGTFRMACADGRCALQ